MNTNVISENEKEHSIAWISFGPEVGFVKAVGSDESLHLPIFLMGNDLNLFKTTGGINFNPVNLVRGILLGLQDDPPTLDIQQIKPFLTKGLDLLVSEFRFKDLEELILSVSTNLREKVDYYSSISSLISGMQLLPESDKIRSDLVVTLWATLELEGSMANDALMQIQEVGSRINFDNLDEEITPIVAYILSVAMIYSGSKEMNNFFNKAATKYVTDPEWLDRLNRLLSGERLTTTELSLGLSG